MSFPSANAESFWVATGADGAPGHPPLETDLEVDVAIVGAGIVGLSAALLLQRAGRRVAVIEALRVGRQVTGRSTAKITSQHGLKYRALEKSFGTDAARAYGEANEAGLARVVGLVEEFGIACDLERKPAYVYSRSTEQLDAIHDEVEVAKRLGLPADFVADCPLPFEIAGAVRFDDQAQFDPFRYLLGLADAVRRGGGDIFEGTRVSAIEHGEPCRVSTARGSITARDVIDATHMPLVSEGMFFTKAYPYAHAAVAARIDAERAPDGMFISAEQPTRSLRTARRGEELWLVAIGAAFKPGNGDEARSVYSGLEAFLRTEFGIQQIDYVWTNEDYESMDGMPFVGRASTSSDHLYVATGFNAWGIAGGTAAAMILSDLITGRSNPWAAVFDATRIKAAAGATRFIGENIGTGASLIGGYLKPRKGTVDDVAAGEAAILNLDGKRTAVFRDEAGHVHAVSAVCTHMRCVLGWNPIDRTWDCPCHGSRFALDGTVVHGPATTALERIAAPAGKAP